MARGLNVKIKVFDEDEVVGVVDFTEDADHPKIFPEPGQESRLKVVLSSAMASGSPLKHLLRKTHPSRVLIPGKAGLGLWAEVLPESEGAAK